jgi:hypothetical protein
MNKQLLHLFAFWSAWFISSQGPVTITVGLREKLIEFLNGLPSSTEGVVELRKQAELLIETESVGVNHPLNRVMFAFMVKHEKEIPDEFQTNLDNIKAFFAARQS